MRFRLAAAIATLGATVLVVAGCGRVTSGDGRTAATRAAAQVTPAARALYQRIYDARIGWSTGMSGIYEECLGNNNKSELDYHLIVDYIYPLRSSIPATAYRLEVMRAVRADGWAFKKNIKSSRDGNLFPYQMQKGQLNGHIAVADTPGESRTFKFSALIEVESTCFDAGPAALSLLNQHMSQIALPHPRPLPSP